MSLTWKHNPRTPIGEACYVSIRIQDAIFDKEILIPRSGGLTEDWNSLGPDSPLDYVLSMTPESFPYKGSTAKILVLDRNVVSEEEVDKIKKETGMNSNEETNTPAEEEPQNWLGQYLPRERGVWAYHVNRGSVGEIAKIVGGTVNYYNYPYVIKFKASQKTSTRLDRQASIGDTIYWNLDEERWEVTTTVHFMNTHRIAEDGEVI